MRVVRCLFLGGLMAGLWRRGGVSCSMYMYIFNIRDVIKSTTHYKSMSRSPTYIANITTLIEHSAKMRFPVSSSHAIPIPHLHHRSANHKQITQALAIALISLTTTAASATSAQVCPNGFIVNIIAYEFPFCLAGKGPLENLFLSRPSDTRIPVLQPPGAKTYGSGCVDVNATKGVSHSFFYTADGSGGAFCQLVTYDQKACEGVATAYPLGVRFSECFSDPERFVKPLVASAKVVCVTRP